MVSSWGQLSVCARWFNGVLKMFQSGIGVPHFKSERNLECGGSAPLLDS